MAWQRQLGSAPVRWWRVLLVGLLLLGSVLSTGNRSLAAEDDAPAWWKPMAWQNPDSGPEVTPRPLPRVKSPWLKPLRLRADVRVEPRNDEYAANELTFERVQRPFHWTNPSDSLADDAQRPLTDQEQIDFEKEHFVWIRPFYWNNQQESEETLSWEQQYVGTPEQQPASSWWAPFYWTNHAGRPSTASNRRAESSSPVASDSSWLAENSAKLHRLPPIDGSAAHDVSQSEELRTLAFMMQEGQLPPPSDPGPVVTEPLQTPEGQAEIVSESDDLDDMLPFEGLAEESYETEGGGQGIIAEAETLGTEPEDNNTLQFLRADTVLLEPGEMQFDYGVTYTLFDIEVPAINDSNFLEHARFRDRELLVPLEIRYGFTRRMQLFVNVPFGWSNIEFTLSDFELFENDGGLGDITFGSTILLREGNHCCSDVVLTLAASAPTGIDPLVVPAGQPGVPSLGNGTWSLAASLLHIRTYDPLVVFYGFGTRQHFERDLNGQEFRPGQEYNYQMGVGFAVNSKVTFSTRFSGAYITEPRLDGERFLGSIREPMAVGLALTIAQCKGLIEPFVDFGLTDEAIESRFGIIWTRY